MDQRDLLGRKGEYVFAAHVMDYCGNERPYFNAIFLGDKSESLDFLVELEGVPPGNLFFFVQVKATKLGYTKNRRLKIAVSGEVVERIKRYPAPTYLVGIDEPTSRSFIVAIHEGVTGPISSISTDHPLDCSNLKRLRDEVRAYWKGRDTKMQGSTFTN